MTKKEALVSEFSAVSKKLETIQTEMLKEFEHLEGLSEFRPIQPVIEPFLARCTVNEASTNFANYKSIRLNVPKDVCDLVSVEGARGVCSYGSAYYEFSYDNAESRNKFLAVIKGIRDLDEKTVAANAIAIATNEKTKTALMKLITDIGIPKRRFDYKTPRSRQKDWILCGWVSEISGAFQTTNFDLESIQHRLVNKYDSLYEADQRKRKEARQQEEREARRKKEERQLAFLLAKYGLNIDGTWHDILRAIIAKNKYLRLAYHLEENRLDWSDGYCTAENGLDGFDIETAQDQEIHDCISDIINREHVDGRYFRDCTWNYDVLYGLVKEQDADLWADYRAVVPQTKYET